MHSAEPSFRSHCCHFEVCSSMALTKLTLVCSHRHLSPNLSVFTDWSSVPAVLSRTQAISVSPTLPELTTQYFVTVVAHFTYIFRDLLVLISKKWYVYFVCAHTLTQACKGGQRTTFRSSSFSSIPWVPGLKLTESCLESISPALHRHLNDTHEPCVCLFRGLLTLYYSWDVRWFGSLGLRSP